MNVTVADYRNTWSERQFAAAVLSAAQAGGWSVSYVPDWLWSLAFKQFRQTGKVPRDWAPPGWPDLVLCRPPDDFLVVELKAAKGTVRSPQLAWISDLRRCGIETYVWRPKDLDFIIERLSPKEVNE